MVAIFLENIQQEVKRLSNIIQTGPALTLRLVLPRSQIQIALHKVCQDRLIHLVQLDINLEDMRPLHLNENLLRLMDVLVSIVSCSRIYMCDP